jgi:hypothetical protein
MRKRPSGMGELDGVWSVQRASGLLPPLVGVRKRIRGDRGSTAIGPLPGFHFDVDGASLRYRRPLAGFVDIVEQETPDRYRGRATFRGREFGRFTMTRAR